jgi:hypothetical protein
MVIDVGKLVQFAVTPGLVHVNVLPPALPDTARLPVQAEPSVAVELKVNVPAKLRAVVVPETVPFVPLIDQLPDTELPACVRFIRMAAVDEPPVALPGKARGMDLFAGDAGEKSRTTLHEARI